MKKSKKILIAALVLVVIVALCGVFVYQKALKVRSELDGIIAPMITDMATHNWNKTAIDRYASPALKQWLVDNKLTNGMGIFASLGPVRQYNGIQQFSINAENVALASDVEFEKGPAIVSMHLTKTEGRWWLNGININSAVLMQNMDKAEAAPIP